MKKIYFIIIFLFCLSQVRAQQSIRDSSIHFFMISPTFAAQFPGADLAKTFGFNMNVGGSFSYKSRTNWILGVEGSFIFGNNLTDTNIFSSISTNQGYIIGTGGTYADVRTYERGYNFNLKAGKLIPKYGPNANCGILITGGVGFLLHKIRIETPGNDAPQLSGNYAQGYDMRTDGINFVEFAGYQYLSNNNKVNFFAGFEFIQGITKNRRTYNFETMSQDNSTHLDLLSGIRVGWVFLIYRRKPAEYYIN